MPSFEDMQRKYATVGTIGQQLKIMADEVMQETMDNDPQTKQAYLYDYYHDDQSELEYGYNPALSETKIPVKVKFIIKSYKTFAKDDVDYHIMFEPDAWNSMNFKPNWFVKNYEKLGIHFPVGLYCDLPDDRGVYHKWLFVYEEPANQFPKFGILKCNHRFMWIEKNGIKKVKHKVWGVNATQNSYTSCGTAMYDTARCIGKPCSVFLRICWNALKAVKPKQKDEISLDGKVKIFTDGVISREVSNRDTLNDYRLKYR